MKIRASLHKLRQFQVTIPYAKCSVGLLKPFGWDQPHHSSTSPPAHGRCSLPRPLMSRTCCHGCLIHPTHLNSQSLLSKNLSVWQARPGAFIWNLASLPILIYHRSPTIRFQKKETAKILIMINADILKEALLCSNCHELLGPGLWDFGESN